MTRRPKVREGQLYRKLFRDRASSRTWEVEIIYEDAALIPHARLVNIRDPMDTRTLSCGALTNRKDYELVADPPAHYSQTMTPREADA